jgi:hypothetical protein
VHTNSKGGKRGENHVAMWSSSIFRASLRESRFTFVLWRFIAWIRTCGAKGEWSQSKVFKRTNDDDVKWIFVPLTCLVKGWDPAQKALTQIYWFFSYHRGASERENLLRRTQRREAERLFSFLSGLTSYWHLVKLRLFRMFMGGRGVESECLPLLEPSSISFAFRWSTWSRTSERLLRRKELI